MNEQQYYRLLHGEGQRCHNTNLVYLPKTAKSIEERSVEKICPPPQLNPNYKPNPKVQRSGKLPQPQITTKRTRIDPNVLKHILA